MKNTIIFARRNIKELLRDPVTFIFALAFPLVLLFLMTAINHSVPVDLFSIETLTPGMAVFGMSFMTLMGGILLSADRETSFLIRLYTTPLTSADFIGGYVIPLFVLGFAQINICFGVAGCLGLTFRLRYLLLFPVMTPTLLLFIAIGLCFGCVCSNKAVGGVASVIVNASAWLSGTWFDLDLVGGTFKKICGYLPFVHALESAKTVISGDFGTTGLHLLWVTGYAVALMVLAIYLFSKQMKN